MEIEQNQTTSTDLHSIKNVKIVKAHITNNETQNSTSLNQANIINIKANKDKVDNNTTISNDALSNLNNKTHANISYKSCLFNDANNKNDNNPINIIRPTSPNFQINNKLRSENNSSKNYNTQILPKIKSKNDNYNSQIQGKLSEPSDNPNLTKLNDSNKHSDNKIINLREDNNNILDKSNNENNNNATLDKTSQKTKGWLFYYDNLECDLKWLNIELTDRIGLEYLSHIISARNDEDIGIYVHIKFSYSIEYDNSLKSSYFDIEYNNKIYQPKIRAVKDWQILSCLCINPDNYYATFNPNKKKIAQSYTNKFLLNNNMSLWIESGEIRLKDIPRNLVGIQLYMDYISRQKIDQKWTKRRKIWLSGQPGVGKSYVVVNSFTDLYHKTLDESWGDYFGQKNVVVELNEDYTPKIGRLLKLWTEDYLFQVPGNNVYLHPQYSTIVIISYYTIEEYFAANNNLILSMTNRCDSIKMEKIEDEAWVSLVLQYGNPNEILKNMDLKA